MDEYISRVETVKAFCEKCKGYYDGHCIHRGECDIDVIKTAPAADVQPVKHGKWNSWGRDTAYNKFYRCSCCNYEISMDVESREFDDSLPKYCLNCGARMDRGEKNETD